MPTARGVFTGGGEINSPRERVKPDRAERGFGGQERRRTGPRSCCRSVDGELRRPMSRERV